ncbi:DUF6777 domain-containing protein [Streptomyces xanthophaeus]
MTTHPEQQQQPPPSERPTSPPSGPPSGLPPGPPPSSPSGPPSGPLSGGQDGPPAAPPPPAPPGGPGGPPGGDAAGRGPWWRSVPRLATALVALAAVVALAVVLTRPSGTSDKARGEVFLQPAADAGPDPFTVSTASDRATPPPPPSPPPTASATTGPTPAPTATRSVSGASPGLYGGTKSLGSCDVEKQIKVLSAQPVKNEAFASALDIRPAAVPGYLRSLTPVQLRWDTRVTNHGFRDGRATPYQAVLQSGTAVLVDDRGVPRVRCACGNPLRVAVPLKADPKRTGQPWSSYQPSRVVVIAPSVTIVNKFVIYDHQDRRWYQRDRGDHHGDHDKPVPPPVVPPLPPSPPPDTSTGPSGEDPGTDTSPGTPTDGGTDTDTGTPTETDRRRDLDSGTPSDPGTPTDTTTPRDRDRDPDSGTPSDPGTPSDADKSSGTPTDTATATVTATVSGSGTGTATGSAGTR